METRKEKTKKRQRQRKRKEFSPLYSPQGDLVTRQRAEQSPSTLGGIEGRLGFRGFCWVPLALCGFLPPQSPDKAGWTAGTICPHSRSWCFYPGLGAGERQGKSRERALRLFPPAVGNKGKQRPVNPPRILAGVQRLAKSFVVGHWLASGPPFPWAARYRR